MAEVDWIAEISSNHNGEIERARELIDSVAEAGFTSVKFQLFQVKKLFSSEALSSKPFLLDREQWELPPEFIPTLSQTARERGLKFGITPFFLEGVSAAAPYVDFFKIASYELLWVDLLREVAKSGKPVVLSTGMATMEEVIESVSVLRTAGARDVRVLHCVSEYPATLKQSNLSAIKSLRENLDLATGWSDHTNDVALVRRAVLRWGASTVELHVDLDSNGYEFDQGHCWLLPDASRLICEIGEGEAWDGNGTKAPTPEELDEREWRADPIDGLRPINAQRSRI